MSDLDRLIDDTWIRKHPNAAGRLRAPVRKTGWMSYSEFITWAAANGQPARPIGRFEKNLPANLPVAAPRPKTADELFPDPTRAPARELNAQEMASLARCLSTKPEE